MCLGFGGESEIETCAPRRVVGSPQVAAVRFNDGAADGQSHTGSMKLRGKERIESKAAEQTLSDCTPESVALAKRHETHLRSQRVLSGKLNGEHDSATASASRVSPRS